MRSTRSRAPPLPKSSTPERGAQRDLDTATANRDRLTAQLVKQEKAMAPHAATAKQDELTKSEAELDRALGCDMSPFFSFSDEQSPGLS